MLNVLLSMILNDNFKLLDILFMLFKFYKLKDNNIAMLLTIFIFEFKYYEIMFYYFVSTINTFFFDTRC